MQSPAVRKKLASNATYIVPPEHRPTAYFQSMIGPEIEKYAARLKAAGMSVESAAPARVATMRPHRFDRLRVIGEGPVVLAFGVECSSPIAESGRLLGIKAGGAVVIGDCLVVVASRRESIATIDIGAGGWIELDRAITISYGEIELLIVDIRSAAILESPRQTLAEYSAGLHQRGAGINSLDHGQGI
jgi:hypothetical protein